MEEKKEDPKKNEISGITRILDDLGLEKKFVGSVIKDGLKEYIKSEIPGLRHVDNKSKFGKTVETIKSMWWVPAAVYISIMLSVLLMKFLSKVMEV